MPEPIPTNVPSFLPYQWHQVAIYTSQPSLAIAEYERLGYRNWIYDEADLVGYLDGDLKTTRAKMAFNYDIFPGELEFLTYEGPNRHREEGRTVPGHKPFISHMSTYVDNVFYEATQIYKTFGLKPYHQFITANNTNPNVAGKKRFIECIYDFRDLLGYDLKLIQKTPWEILGRHGTTAWTKFDVSETITYQDLMDLARPFTRDEAMDKFNGRISSAVASMRNPVVPRRIKDTPQA